MSTTNARTVVEAQEYKHGEKRDNLMDVVSSYVHVEEIETLSHIGLEIHVEGDLSKQTGTVRDLLKNQCDNWEVRDIHIGDGEMWSFEVIYVE